MYTKDEHASEHASALESHASSLTFEKIYEEFYQQHSEITCARRHIVFLKMV